MDHYAFHLIAMSMEEAKATLGFPLDAMPTPAEIKEAWKKKVFEVHPDRPGGDTEAAALVNAAKDILEGKMRPSYSRSAPSPASPGPRRYEPHPTKEVSFQEAESKAGIPSGVTWQFVTDRQRGVSWSADESSQSDSYYVAYGRTERQHVFVGVRHFTKTHDYIGGPANSDIWTIKSVELPIQKDEGKNPAWLYGNVVKALKGVDFSKGRFNSKVIDATGWTFSHRLPTGGEQSIKNWLVGSGEVAADAPSVAGRKQVVEFTFEKAYEAKPGFTEEPPLYAGSISNYYYKFALILNARRYDLDEADATKILKIKAGGHTFLELIFGRYHYGGEKKNLTRMPKGKKVIHWMTENLKSLPDDAMNVMRAAEAQMKG